MEWIRYCAGGMLVAAGTFMLAIECRREFKHIGLSLLTLGVLILMSVGN